MNYRSTLLRHRASLSRPFLAATLIAGLAGGCCPCSSKPVARGSLTGSDDENILRVDGPVIARVHATGYQVYVLQPDAAEKPAWKLKAPDATFQSDDGLAGKHYAGPTWESTTDGSAVVGRKIGEHAASSADAVPWLLLEAASHRGSGRLSNVTYIRRINTTGGKPPPTEGATAGDERRVPYSADYVFYGPGATTRATTP